MRTPIFVRRGNKADLPVLGAGEPAVAVDTKQLFIGTNGTIAGNIGLLTSLSGGFKVQSGTTAPVNASTTYSISFPVQFSSIPQVMVIAISASPVSVSIASGNASSVAFVSSSADSLQYYWFAIGS